MPRNNADFQGIQYIHTTSHPTSHELEAFDHKANDVVGYMRWDKDSGVIHDISVDEPFRRKGIATGMYEYAKQLAARSNGEVSHPVHSPVRTPSGEAWSKSVG